MKIFASKRTQRVTNFALAAILAVSTLTASVPFIFSQKANALSQATSTAAAPNGWYTEDGAPSYVTAPAGTTGNGALEFQAVGNSGKNNYFHSVPNLPLGQVSNLGYSVYDTSGIPASYQMEITGANRLNSTTSSYTTLIWEPVYNGKSNSPTAGYSDNSNLETGTWWSSNPIAGASDRNTFVSLQTILAANPNAVVISYGAGVGSGTPGAVSYVDNISFGDTSYDFAGPVVDRSTVYVSNTGDDSNDGVTAATPFATIQKAVNTVSANGTVNVAAGTYNEAVTVAKAMSIKGAQAGVDARSRSTAESVVTATSDAFNFNVTASNVTIDGFTLNSPTGDAAAVKLFSGNGTGYHINNNIINDASRAVLFNTSGVKLYRNLITNANAGTYIAGFEENSMAANNVVIESNQFVGGTQNADINFIGSTSTTSTGLEVKSNSSVNGVSFLGLTNTTGASIHNNTVTGAPQRAIFVGGNNSGTRINNNVVSTTNATGAGVIVVNAFGYGANSDIQGSGNNFAGSVNGVVVYPGALTTDQTADFSHSWWGSASGPKDPDATDGSSPASNPSGTGAGAYGAVTYGPWYVNAGMTELSNHAPVVAITSPADGAFLRGTVTVKGTVTDGDPSVSYLTVTNDATQEIVAVQNVNTALTNPSVVWDTTQHADGAYTIHLEAKDAVGNEDATASVKNIHVTVDNEVPTYTVKASSVGSGSSFSKLDLQLHDNTLVAGYTVNDTYFAVTPSAYSDANDIAIGSYHGEQAGQNTVVVYDVAGNPSATFTFTLDNVAPTVSIDTIAPNATTISGRVDESSIVTVSINGTDYTDFSTDGTWSVDVPSLDDGDYPVSVVATDEAGNTTTPAVTAQLTIDTTGPATHVNAATADTDQPQITGTVDSDAVSVEVYVLNTDNTIREQGAATISSDGTMWTYDVQNPLANGTYTIVAVAKDAVGNESSAATAGFATLTVDVPAASAADTDATTVAATTTATPTVTSIITPIITSPAAAAVLGATTDNTDATTNDAAVKGATDDKTVAAAANSDANKGTIFGLAWYWWILILAALAAIAWFIIAAIRRRNEE